MLHKVFCIVALFMLASCGFEPLYATQRVETKDYYYNAPKKISVVDDLAKVYIEPIEGRIGQQLSNALKVRFNPYGAPKKSAYFLVIAIDEPKIEQGIRMDNTATRETIVFDAEYKLIKNGVVLIEDNSKAEASYNILTMPYGTIAAIEDAKKRVATMIADDIALRVGVFFKNLADEKYSKKGQEN